MPCCGDKRTAFLPQSSEPPTRPAAPAGRHSGWFADRPGAPATSAAPAGQSHAVPTPPAFGSVTIRYIANPAIIVRGPATRQEYRFSGAQPRQQVARADVEALLASGYFTRDS